MTTTTPVCYDHEPIARLPSDVTVAYVLSGNTARISELVSGASPAPDWEHCDAYLFYVVPDLCGYEHLLMVWSRTEKALLVWGLEPMEDGLRYVARACICTSPLRVIPALKRLGYACYAINGAAYNTFE